MKLVDANPIFKRGAFAVWLVEDIPEGVERHAAAADARQAINNIGARPSCRQTAGSIAMYQDSGAVAAVAWADLQPRKLVPRGRASMTAAQWGLARDQNGVCTICNADDSMWCDTVEHDQHAQRALAQAYSSTLISPHMSRSSGAEVFQVGVAPIPRQQANYRCEPVATADPPTRQMDRIAVLSMSAALAECRPQPTTVAREAWSRELRRLVATSAERERNRVVVDRDFED